MTSLVILPRSSDAFSAYKPSKNAHIDILAPQAKDKGASGKALRLDLHQPVIPLDSAIKLDLIELAIPRLLAGQPTPTSFHAIANCCRHLVADPRVDLRKVYDNIEENLVNACRGIQRECRASILGDRNGNGNGNGNGGGGKWLGRLVGQWERFEANVTLLAALCVYLDRVYCIEGSGNMSILDRATAQFRKLVWSNDLLLENTRNEFLAWAAAEREAAGPDAALRPAATAVVALANRLATPDDLVKPYLVQTQEHYAAMAATHVSNVETGALGAMEYVKWALDKEAEEAERARAVVSSQVADKAVVIVREENGAKVAARVVQKALDEAMYAGEMGAIVYLYMYSVDSRAFNLFCKAIHDHIETRIRTVISDPANDAQMIESTLKLKRFADRAVAVLFSRPPKNITAAQKEADDQGGEDGDGQDDVAMAEPRKIPQHERLRQLELEEAVRSGFKAGLGSRQNAPAEWIAKHLDAAMRKGQGSGTEREFNALLDEIIALVGFTRDKDVFRAFYASGLAKRLLLNKSASDDMERNMIVKLQNEMGDEFTSGDVMMKDLQVSETLVKAYQSARVKNPGQFKDSSYGEFTANVLTESAWPPYPLLKDGWDFKLTPQLQSSIDTFTTWYSTQHQNRQLSWRHQLATVTLTARFDSGQYEIGVSLFQAVVLLQFTEADVLDFMELKSRTGIESSELIRVLQSLSMGRKGTRVLIKRPAGKAVEPTDKFAFNKGFTSDRIKFKINQIQQDLSADESRKTNEQVAIDRVSVMEATIVRIMKGRKKMTLQLLIDAVVTDVSKRFPPDVKEIKKRVESLIEREYLQRDEHDRNKLQYLA